MIWGIIRRRVASSWVTGQSASRIRPAAVRPRCYAQNEAVISGSNFEHFQSFSYSTSLGIHVANLRREATILVQHGNHIISNNRSFSSKSGDLVDAVVPFMGESITDGTLAKFLKKPGDRVEVDEPIAQIETDKVTIDVTSPEAGVIQKLVAKEGETVEPGTKIAVISKSAEAVTQSASPEKAVPDTPISAEKESEKAQTPTAKTSSTKESKRAPASAPEPAAKAPSPPPKPMEPQLPPKDRERRVPMTRLRKRVATRLKDSQNTFAMLTTFNEVDMTNSMKLRSEYKDAFVEKHGVKLGFMSGFVKAAVSALQYQPVVNAVIDGDDIIYRDYIDISIAVGTPKGLVVPVIRNAGSMNFAEIEKEINTLAKKANDGSISIDEMAGGTFTISNGGVYGSLLSTPIINPPQLYFFPLCLAVCYFGYALYHQPTNGG
ncbi:dihydrolipoyllysine-residue succinyltransferase component of 2-oxoglutarate dehydrogenase complex 1, mitochondrial isoform X2 [Manihot esculenta]|uniref:dihydrolipoyllysine-residue succinyltransferase component of 2-oxoglutarate dehydrogenase complex 1, mitochondrial isoform X2 n=1 Tax=Manihot esculenta TaxID=3983 RepID=UPI001CC68425|nr:dihydrolipoyllysine-residue succinyltransferase component of 2-oxoglutarate dehydrogenase complex 1, mitochondrial isoform X2 [Manihot esculenta]